jgi:tRNA pseudouridine38-40 synthase
VPPAQPTRWALGVAYRGTRYHGWQSQPDGLTVQDTLERALGAFAAVPGAPPIATVCAGRTDAGVHATNQVVHFDAPVQRDASSWVRGTNRYLPADVAVQWAQPVAPQFHARFSAHGRRYRYVLLQSAVRPALDQGRVGWEHRPLNGAAMQAAAACLLGTHDFSAFRASACQAATPVKTLHSLHIRQRGAYWSFDFDGNAFLHHMVRNIVGSLLYVGAGRQPVGWMADVLAARSRDAAAPTFGPDGLYFLGPYYGADHPLPSGASALDGLPG